jgi:methionyl aminopeptidase
VPVGSVPDDWQKLVQVTNECLERAIEQCWPGKHLGDIGWAVQEWAENHGYSVVRDYVGHGIGRQMHEDPQIPNYGRPGQGPKIKAGYVFAVEPMVNMGGHHTKVLADGWTVVTLDGKPSAHSEHTIAITEDGPEVLTRVTAEQSKPVVMLCN